MPLFTKRRGFVVKLLLLLSLCFTGCFNQDSKIYITTYAEREVIDLNSATKEELATLPNIGDVKINKIIESRKERPFKSLADFQGRHLIGDTAFEDIKEEIYVNKRVD